MPTHLIVTASDDGVLRASTRIEFRIGRPDLILGLAWYLEQTFENLCELSPLHRAIALATRETVYGWTRDMLRDRGQSFALGTGSKLRESTWHMAAVKVGELFPEFDTKLNPIDVDDAEGQGRR